jgi:hypothetical protein
MVLAEYTHIYSMKYHIKTIEIISEIVIIVIIDKLYRQRKV